MKLTIDRLRWLRGTYPSFLMRGYDAKMCCVGFYCKQLGIPDSSIIGKQTIQSLEERSKELVPDWATVVRVRQYKDINTLYEINDNLTLTPIAREIAIAAIFAKHGVEVEFVN